MYRNHSIVCATVASLFCLEVTSITDSSVFEYQPTGIAVGLTGIALSLND
jgi:hypothetical protein